MLETFLYQNIHVRYFLEWPDLVVLKGDCVEDEGWENRVLLRSKAVQSPPPGWFSGAADFDFACVFRVSGTGGGRWACRSAMCAHGDYQFCYSFCGRPGHKPSILMLHGFSAHKDMWLSMVKVGCARALPPLSGCHSVKKKRRERVLLEYDVIRSGRK